MSVYASRWALDRLAAPDCPLSTTARLALMALAAEANYKTGRASTGRKRLAAVLGVHPGSAWRAVRELRAWAPLPCVEVRGKGIDWTFPVSPDIAEAVAEADAELSTPSAPARMVELSTPSAPARRPSAPARMDHPRQRDPKGLGTTDVVKEGGAASAGDELQAPRDGPEEDLAQHDEPTKPTQPQWIAEGLTYGQWIRRERAAGRMPKHNPARGAG